MQFSKEQWQEINETRDRLDAIKNKIQPYPAYPEPNEPQQMPYIPRPIVNVTYQVHDVNTPAFKDLENKIKLLDGRLTKYFEPKKKPQASATRGVSL